MKNFACESLKNIRVINGMAFLPKAVLNLFIGIIYNDTMDPETVIAEFDQF